MYECGKQIFHSTHENACTANAMSTSKTEELVSDYKYYYEEMVQHINAYHKEPERRAVDSKYITVGFEDAASITVNSASLITQDKKWGRVISPGKSV